MRYRKFLMACCVAILVLPTVVLAQNGKKNSPMNELLDGRQYTFTAQYMQPMSGKQVYLTGLYTLTVTHDSLVCDLPYFGVAYVAPMNPADNGLHFVSNHFDYNVMPAKHGRNVVAITVNDRTVVRQMFLNVAKNGYATLQVTPTNRQAISYYGTVKTKVQAK